MVLAGAGVTYAATGSDQNQVGTEYANGIQVSDNQIIKPLGDRLLTQFGKFMGSTVSPDGRFLYVDESRIGKVGAFAVNGGNLTELGTSPFALPAGATPAGIVAS